MKVTVNGENTTLEGAVNVLGFLEETGYSDKIVAVAINGAFVPKSVHSTTQIKDGDNIEIVAPMQGG